MFAPTFAARPLRSTLLLCGLVGLATACAEKTAQLELDAADRAIASARSNRASDCAPELQRAAEDALAQARRLAEAGEIEEAKNEASKAASLAQRAESSSPPGCDEKVAEAEVPDETDGMSGSNGLDVEDASRTLGELESNLQTVYFEYNQSSIKEESKEVLSRVAELLRNLPTQSLEIEGHCDVRGSTEYNLHLGERRARSVMKYLTTQGVEESQLLIISYGEERPADFGSSESAHAANRRAELRLL